MGAGCSSPVLTRYKHLRAYLLSKPCLTFDMVETFLPVNDRPPVILIGESHNTNESESMVQRCVTAFTAMKHIISDCADPAVKIFFVMESLPQPLVEKGRPSPKEYKTAIETNKFNLLNVWGKADFFTRIYSDGLSVIPFDMFYKPRGLFGPGNFMVRDPAISRTRVMDRTKQGITAAFEHMGVDRWELPTLFTEMDSKMEHETENYRTTVTAFIDQENADAVANQQVRLDKNEEDEETILFTTNIYHYWMFQIVYWCYCFTTRIIEDTRVPVGSPDHWNGQSLWEEDVFWADAGMRVGMQNILKKPTMLKMFLFITLCGDYVTYFIYLRERLAETNPKSIYVLYGGSQHMQNFSELISRLKTHKQDFVRVSNAACKEDRHIYKKWCEDMEKSKTRVAFDKTASW